MMCLAWSGREPQVPSLADYRNKSQMSLDLRFNSFGKDTTWDFVIKLHRMTKKLQRK